MDNDNKIKDANSLANVAPANSIVKYFLKDELEAIGKDTLDLYNLEDEYAKTPKNRSYFVAKVLAACFLVVALFTFGLCFYLSKKANKIAVNIDVFQDINLKGMLDLASRTDASYQNAVRNKNELEAALEFSLKEALQKKDEDIFMLNSMRLGKDLTNKRTKLITDEYTATCKNLHADFDMKIDAAQKDVEHFKELLDQYNNQAGKDAQGRQAAIDSERQLHQLEIQRLNKSYSARILELEQKLDKKQVDSLARQKKSVSEVTKNFEERLDPKINDEEALKIKKQYGPESALPFNAFAYKNQFIYATKQSDFCTAIDSLETQEEVAFEYLKNNVLTKALIDHQNSIPDFYKLQNKITSLMLDKIATGAVATIEDYALQLEKANKKIAGLNNYFEDKCTKANAQGIILDATNPTLIKVYISKAINQKNFPMQAKVLRGTSTTPLCTLFVTQEEDFTLVARPTDETNRAQIEKARLKEGDRLTFN